MRETIKRYMYVKMVILVDNNKQIMSTQSMNKFKVYYTLYNIQLRLVKSTLNFTLSHYISK